MRGKGLEHRVFNGESKKRVLSYSILTFVIPNGFSKRRIGFNGQTFEFKNDRRLGARERLLECGEFGDFLFFSIIYLT